jgi:hypothetical protein
MWARTCLVGVHAGCITANMSDFSILQVTAVNTGTGVVDFTYVNPDTSTGATHAPLVGELVLHGYVYPYGAPRASRYAHRLQIYNPMHFAPAALGANDAPVYVEEVDLYSKGVVGFGHASLSTGGVSIKRELIGVFADTVARQVIFCFRNAVYNGNFKQGCYVFDVS